MSDASAVQLSAHQARRRVRQGTSPVAGEGWSYHGAGVRPPGPRPNGTRRVEQVASRSAGSGHIHTGAIRCTITIIAANPTCCRRRNQLYPQAHMYNAYLLACCSTHVLHAVSFTFPMEMHRLFAIHVSAARVEVTCSQLLPMCL